MNGSRLREHRKSRVPATAWMVAIGLIAAAVALGATYAKGAGEQGHTGHTLKGFHTCMANKGINQDSAKLLFVWMKLVKKYDDFAAGSGVPLTEKEMIIAQMIQESAVCGQMTGEYPGIALDATDGYLLFQFDPQLGFGSDNWLIFREGFVLDK